MIGKRLLLSVLLIFFLFFVSLRNEVGGGGLWENEIAKETHRLMYAFKRQYSFPSPSAFPSPFNIISTWWRRLKTSKRKLQKLPLYSQPTTHNKQTPQPSRQVCKVITIMGMGIHSDSFLFSQPIAIPCPCHKKQQSNIEYSSHTHTIISYYPRLPTPLPQTKHNQQTSVFYVSFYFTLLNWTPTNHSETCT